MAFGKGHHLHLIDGSAFIFRAYHALPPLTRKSDGLPVGAVAGFCNMLQRYVENNTGPDAPTHVAVIFDHSGKTFRNDMYDLYKANRSATPEDLIPQFPLTRAATRAFNVACKEVEGFEADDIIATLACRAREAGGACTIISSDKDLMQLVGGGVVMLDAYEKQGELIATVLLRNLVSPRSVWSMCKLWQVTALTMCPVRPALALKPPALLINEYGSLEELLDRAGEIKQPKRRESLMDNRPQIELSKQLVQLDCNMELDFSIEDLEVRDPNPRELMAFVAEMEFRTLSKRLSEKLGVEAPTIAEPEVQQAAIEAPAAVAFDARKYETIPDAVALQAWIDRIYARGYVAVDTETTGLNEMRADLVGVSLCVEAGEAAYLPLTHRAGQSDDLFGTDALAEGQMDHDTALAMLKPMLEDSTILKIGQNMKYDAKILARVGIQVAPIDDTMLMSYAQNGGLHNHGMDLLSARYLDHAPISIKTLLGSGKSAITFDRVSIDEASRYAAEDADITLRLWHYLKPRLHLNRVTSVYASLERPLVPVLADMEMQGIKVDRDVLSRMSNGFATKDGGFLRLKFTRWQGGALMSDLRSSLAKCSLMNWRSRAARRAKLAPMPPGSMCWKIWRRSMNCPGWF